MMLCIPCGAVFSENNALPSEKVIAERKLRESRADEQEIICSQCSAVEVENPSKARKFGTDTDGNIICRMCLKTNRKKRA
jgi:rubredoxin